MAPVRSHREGIGAEARLKEAALLPGRDNGRHLDPPTGEDPEQLRQLITLEAEGLGLTFDDAVKLARERRLPKTPLGADLELLVQLLPA